MRSVQTLIPFMHTLADAAAEVILPMFRSDLAVANKAGKAGFDPVTYADREAEQAIRSAIRNRYPDHGIFGEEFDDENASARFSWIVDPIDGTRAFICGLPLWGVLIGLRDDGEPVLGMMSQPYLGERFVGTGDEAWLESRGGGRRQLKTRRCANLSDAILSTTSPDIFPGDDGDRFRAVERQVKLVRYGYDCYAYTMVAMGQIDCVVESGLKAYDIDPIIPIIRGAGGYVTDWDGNAATGGGRVIAAGDRRVLDQALAILSQA